MIVGVLSARLAFGWERGLAWEEIGSPAPGGYALYGALPGLLVVALWLRARGQGPGPHLEAASPWILLAIAIGRIGCAWVGCCRGVGMESETWGELRVPAPLFAAMGNAGLAGLLLRRLGLGRKRGTAALALAGHATLRTILDPFREESITQGGVAIPLALYGGARFAWLRSRRPMR
jgi:prolipoprotein diacylglyceryltransferase